MMTKPHWASVRTIMPVLLLLAGGVRAAWAQGSPEYYQYSSTAIPSTLEAWYAPQGLIVDAVEVRFQLGNSTADAPKMLWNRCTVSLRKNGASICAG